MKAIIYLLAAAIVLISCTHHSVETLGAGGNNRNYGNIVYVSKYGDNTTAQLGNPDRPFADPWAARNAVPDSGWVVEVMSGLYTIGDTLSGADRIARSNQAYDTLHNNLARKDITYNLHSGATIRNICDTGKVILFYSRSGGTIRITGNGNIEVMADNINSQTFMLSGYTLFLRLNKWISYHRQQGSTFNNSQGINNGVLTVYGEVDVEVSEVEYYNSTLLRFAKYYGNQKVKLGTVRAGRPISMGPTDDNTWPMYHSLSLANLTVRQSTIIEIGNVIQYNDYNNGFAINKVDSSTFSFKVGNWFQRPFSTGPQVELIFFGHVWTGDTLRGTSVSLHVDNYDGYGYITELLQSPNGGSNILKVTGKYICQANRPLFELDRSDNSYTDNRILLIADGYFQSMDTAVVVIGLNQKGNAQFSGTFYPQSGVPAIVFTGAPAASGKILLQNLFMLVTDGTAAVLSSAAINLAVGSGVSASSTTVDADVTEVGGTILKSASLDWRSN